MRSIFNGLIKSQIRNQRMASFHLQGCHLLLLFVCFLAASAFAPDLSAQNKPAPATAAVPPNRFLFIVDTSASMERHARDVQQLVVNLLSTSASGQLHRGDTLGVWTFNADVYTGNLPLQRWIPEDWWQIATHITEFLQQQHYGKKSRLDRALADMYEVIGNSDIITVFLISNGEGKMQGNPFAAEINAAYKESLKDMKKDRMPVVTVLQAKGGKIIKYTVNALPWPVVVPELPIAIKKVQAPPLQANPAPTVAVPQNPALTNQPLVAATPATTPPLGASPQSTVAAAPVPAPAPVVNAPPPPPPAVTVPPVVKPESPPVAAVPPSSVPLPTRQFKPPAAEPAVSAKSEPPVARPDSATVAPALPAAPLPPPVAVPTAAQPAAAITSPPPQPKPVQVAQANPVADAAVAHPTNSLAVQATAVLPPAANTRPKFFLIAGITLVLIALGLIALMVRRARTSSGPSLITTSMDNRKK